jgi:hypothetical protein
MTKGAINKRLKEKALAIILVLSYSDILVAITKIIDPGVIRVRLTE